MKRGGNLWNSYKEGYLRFLRKDRSEFHLFLGGIAMRVSEQVQEYAHRKRFFARQEAMGANEPLFSELYREDPSPTWENWDIFQEIMQEYPDLIPRVEAIIRVVDFGNAPFPQYFFVRGASREDNEDLLQSS